MNPSSPDANPQGPRVLFVDHSAQLGGAELSLFSVVQDFRATGRVVLFEDGPFADRLQQAGIATTVLPVAATLGAVRRDGSFGAGLRALPGLLRLAWRLGRLARSYDVLLANSQKAMLVSALAGLVARRPVVWYLRDLMSPAHFGPGQRWLAAALARVFVTRIIANSQATADAFIANGGPTSRTSVVHNGIDDGPFRRVAADDVAAVRRELGLPSEGVVGVFSRMAEWKGQLVLLEALRSLPDVTALLVGDALFPEDERYAARLRTAVESWGLADQVRMTGFREDIPTLMKACDVILHTSTAPEPFGRVIVEGMMAGRPVIATEGGGPSEIITHGASGLLIPPGDPAVLRASIQRVLRNETEAARLAEEGRTRARSFFSTPQMVQAVRQLLTDATGFSTAP